MKLFIYILIIVFAAVVGAFAVPNFNNDNISGNINVIFNYEDNADAPFHVEMYHWDNTLITNVYDLDERYYTMEEMRIKGKDPFYKHIRQHLIDLNLTEYVYPEPIKVLQLFQDQYIPSREVTGEFNVLMEQLDNDDYDIRNDASKKLFCAKFVLLIIKADLKDVSLEVEYRIKSLRSRFPKIPEDQAKILILDKQYLLDSMVLADAQLRILLQKKINSIK